MKPIIYLATDHAGLEHKEYMEAFLRDRFPEYEVVDCGPETLNPDDDYPDIIKLAAQGVSDAPNDAKGIIFGGSGEGEAMVANRFHDVRCTVYYGGAQEIVTLSKEHNNANMLSIGARFVTKEESTEIVRLWLSTKFDPHPRHIRRIAKMNKLTHQIQHQWWKFWQ